MTKKQLKALRRHKSIVRKRNIRNNNVAVTPATHLIGKSHTYRLYFI